MSINEFFCFSLNFYRKLMIFLILRINGFFITPNMKTNFSRILKIKSAFILISIGYCFIIFVKLFIFLVSYYYNDFITAVNAVASANSFFITNFKNNCNNNRNYDQDKLEEAVEEQTVIQRLLKKCRQPFSFSLCILLLFVFGGLFFIVFKTRNSLEMNGSFNEEVTTASLNQTM